MTTVDGMTLCRVVQQPSDPTRLVCTTCREEKSKAGDFYATGPQTQNFKTYGVLMPCKACQAVRMKRNNSRPAAKARANARRRKRRATEPEYAEATRAAKRTPKARAVESQRRTTRYRSDPVYRTTENARNRTKYDRKPELRKRQAVATKAKRATPVGRAAHNAANAKRKKTPHGRMLSAFAAQRRRARKYAVDDGLTPKVWIAICDAFDCRCAYCGREEDDDIQIEHVVPISRGGRHGHTNVVPACERCNLKKNAKSVDDFLADSGLDPAPVAERFALALQRLGEAA